MNGGDEEVVDLPPGFRFHPTDEEIITHYLVQKVVNGLFASCVIGEADLNKCEPWDLPKMAKMGEKEWYFFCQKDRKYPTGMRTNRATESGYWKATGKDKEIFRGRNCLVGMKKTLVFYKGRAPKGEKSNWVIHEYRLDGELAHYHFTKPSKDEWVVCRVFHKSTGIRKNPIFPTEDSPIYSLLPPNEPIPSFIHAEDDHGRDDGVGNQYHFHSGFAMDGISSYMRGTQDSDLFVGYQGTINIQGSGADASLRSMVSPSQDTGASADAYGEITSSFAVSGYQPHMNGFEAYEDPERPSVDPISDILECSWD